MYLLKATIARNEVDGGGACQVEGDTAGMDLKRKK